MARTALSELQQQIEEVRQEAFAAGYAAAMQAVRELALQRPPEADAPQRGSGARRKAAAAKPARTRPARKTETAARPVRSAARARQGANAERVQEILKASGQRGLRAAEIRKALQEKGIEMSFTAIRQGLGQLQSRNAAEQVGDTKTWRHRGST
jgi:hypothetical protein